MPRLRIGGDFEMHYEVDDFTDPWREPETILMLHGNAESGAMWFGWVPTLARHYRVVRPDMRGFGASTPMPRGYAWTLDGVIDDFVALMDALAVQRFHLVGAKIAGTIARRFAARFPQRVQTLTLAGVPGARREHKPGVLASWLERIEKEGVEAWARSTMSGRLGSRFPREGFEWWAKLMGRTAVSTQLGFVATIPSWDVSEDLPRIQCPTLVITTEGSALGSVDDVRAWQQVIPDSRLVVVPGDSFHVAATDAERCARETLEFLSSQRAQSWKRTTGDL
ncbi:MAG: alpha/beta fold hydrolase [Burkholderiales bacterium]